jgi:hypothetical protein
MHHYIITRFSILDSPTKQGFRRNNSEDYLFSKERLDFKFFVFDKITYNSVISQTYTNYKWLIYASAYLPQVYKEKLNTYKNTNIDIIYVKDFKDMRIRRKEVLKDKNNYTTMRLDDDDGISYNFLELLNQYSDQTNKIVSFPNGTRYTVENNNIILGSKISWPKIGLGLTAVGFDIYSAGNHVKVDEKYEVIYDNTENSYFLCCSEFCDSQRKFYV